MILHAITAIHIADSTIAIVVEYASIVVPNDIFIVCSLNEGRDCEEAAGCEAHSPH
jgi:hypothetical protein